MKNLHTKLLNKSNSFTYISKFHGSNAVCCRQIACIEMRYYREENSEISALIIFRTCELSINISTQFSSLYVIHEMLHLSDGQRARVVLTDVGRGFTLQLFECP